MTAYQLLAIARDARLEGRDADYAAVLDEIGVDVEHVRFETRRRPLKPIVLGGEDPSYMRELGRFEQAVIERRAWVERSSIATGSWDAYWRSMYPPGNIAAMATAQHPLFAMLPRVHIGGSDVAVIVDETVPRDRAYVISGAQVASVVDIGDIE